MGPTPPPSVLSPKYEVFCCDQNGPPARREEGAYLKRYVTDEQRSRRPIFIATLWAGNINRVAQKHRSRGEELQKLISGLTKSGKDAVAQPQIIHGGGGTGKSRLAIQPAWLLYLEEKCDMAFFVSAATPVELDTQLASLDAP